MFLGIFLGSLTNNFQSLFLFELVSSYLVSGLFDVIGQIFINLLKLLVVPLVFVSLVCGVGWAPGPKPEKYKIKNISFFE